jgi:hypothetical protein
MGHGRFVVRSRRAKTRIGNRALACSITSSSASKSRSLRKMRIRPTARFSTWYAYPPPATRNRRGMAGSCHFPPVLSRTKTPDPLTDRLQKTAPGGYA